MGGGLDDHQPDLDGIGADGRLKGLVDDLHVGDGHRIPVVGDRMVRDDARTQRDGDGTGSQEPLGRRAAAGPITGDGGQCRSGRRAGRGVGRLTDREGAACRSGGPGTPRGCGWSSRTTSSRSDWPSCACEAVARPQLWQ